MTNPVGLSRWYRVAIGAAVAVQCAALARVSPWLHPAWVAVLAVAVGVAAAPELRVRSLWQALGARLALTAGAIGLAAVVIRALVAAGGTALAGRGGCSVRNLLALAG